MEKLIELKNFNLTYDNEKSFVFKNANFDINKIYGGNITVIIGESGCGKSTILRFISNLQKPSSGEIKICDGQVGMIFQKYSSLEWYTVYQNVMLGLKNIKLSKTEKHDKVIEMLDLVGLKEHKDKFAQYPTLSGGQLQRVAIARSLIQQPKLLLMDEPFGALDIGTRLKMQELLLDIRKKTGTSIVLVTHDIKEAVYLADSIYLIGQEGIKERLYVPFSRMDRNRRLLRRQEFVNMVYEIEDKLIKR